LGTAAVRGSLNRRSRSIVARIVVKSLIETLDLGARALDHLRKIRIAEEKRSGDLCGLLLMSRYE
jgi:hypothetical protein